MNNFSLLAADRLTHLKLVMLAFACVTLVVGFGLVHSALAQEPTSISTMVATTSQAPGHTVTLHENPAASRPR